MRVNVVCAGRFLAFELSSQLKRLGCLGRHYTCTPLFTGRVPLAGYGLSRQDVRTLAPAEVFRRVAGGLGRRARIPADQVKLRWFQRWVTANFEPCDVVHAWAGSALAVFRRQVGNGAVRVLDRSAAHRLVSRTILQEEYARYGAHLADCPEGVAMELEEYRLADGVLVPSSFVLKSFLEQGFRREKLFCVPFGSPMVGVGRPRSAGKHFRVLYVGALTVPKGVRYLLEAASMLRRLPRLEVLLVGPRPEPLVEPLLARSSDCVRYLGYRPKTVLYSQIYPTASVLVQPSVVEGLSFVILEALAHGVPVIATEHTGAADVMADGQEGFIVPIRSPEAIARKVEFLYRRPDVLEEMSARALARARTQVTWEQYGKRVVDVYRRLLRGRNDCG